MHRCFRPVLMLGLSALASLTLAPRAGASIAYGSINNFDTVNDTGHEAHGFEIELDDVHSTDITYTYDYNHYGTPTITEDNSNPSHPKVFIRWQSKKNPDGTWAAYTAIPAGPIAPTDGHMFTNPAINFGGEHFGAGYTTQPSAVLYHWLVDDGTGTLVSGGPVLVATPTFTYFPPVIGNPAPPQVQAVIAPPPPPVPDPLEFGKAIWVKEIRTTSHKRQEIKLRDLISEDPDKPERKNWRNGEPDEVETEWQILQKDYKKADAPNNKHNAAAEGLPHGDEVVTRRYEFFKYAGPIDAETGEALAESVGADGIHGKGSATIGGVLTDLSTVVVVGDFSGSQMAAVDVDAPVGLIDHVGDGELNVPYAERAIVVAGPLPFTSVMEGILPLGMTYDEVTGILSGTPEESGAFNFTVTASDGVNPDVNKSYTLTIADMGAGLPPTSLLDTAVSPIGAGVTTGDGAYDIGSSATVTATANPGYAFLNWTDNGTIVSTSSSYMQTMDVSHSLVANFTSGYFINASVWPALSGTITGGGGAATGSSVTVSATASAGYAFVNWTDGGVEVSTNASYTFTATADRTLVANFSAVPSFMISASALPAAGGGTSGGGRVSAGDSVTVFATANAHYTFTRWTESDLEVSTVSSYTFSASADRVLVAHFVPNSDNQAPLAVKDEFEVLPGSPAVTLEVLANDSDADNDVVSVVSITALNPRGAGALKKEGVNVRFTPSATFTGDSTATFSYTIKDALGGTSTAEVKLKVGDCKIKPDPQSVPSAGDSYMISVNTSALGSWMVKENALWITVDTLSGSGDGAVEVTVLPNPTKNARTGYITIGGTTHTVSQDGLLAPQLMVPAPIPDCIVSANYTLPIPTKGEQVTYTVNGMPPGLTINQANGVISGIPTKDGDYHLYVKATNAAGPSNTVDFHILVQALKENVYGVFHGIVDRSQSFNDGLGARLELAVTKTGLCTGKLITGTSSTPIKGQLAAEASALDTASLNLSVPQKGGAGQPLDLVVDGANNTISGFYGEGGSPIGVKGWRSIWKVPDRPASAYSTLHTFSLEQSIVDPMFRALLPCGYGFGSFTVNESTGAVAGGGHLADNSSFTLATFVGPQGQVLMYQGLYSNRGSLAGVLTIKPGASKSANTIEVALTDTVDWMKNPSPGNSTDTVYKSGFFALTLKVEGAAYVPPGKGEVVLGLDKLNTTDNALLDFSFGGLDTEGKEFNIIISLLNPSKAGLTNRAVIPPFNARLPANPNPHKVNMPTLNAATGLFNGDFTMAGANAANNRKATFQGQIVKHSTGIRGYGFFLLHELPDAKRETLTNTPQHSGRVILEAAR